ncbi:MAG: FHA domain-containing protein [Candidatus Amulumruptor caecigallinarius]|nr:FHA domain-containing protein [Candidatus Amulumruptor caecigallinarius]
MQKKTCPKGHVYDPAIYGDECPLCPRGVAGGKPVSEPKTQLFQEQTPGAEPRQAASSNLHTHIANSNVVNRPKAFAHAAIANAVADQRQQAQTAPAQQANHTMIRHVGHSGPHGIMPSRRLVGFLVTYNRDPNGKAFNIYEGRNFVGRDESCDISVPDDPQMSGRHMSILYRNVDGKFKFRDEQSSNGTFINKELLDEGELQNYDIIRVGSTIFIFIAVPSLS